MAFPWLFLLFKQIPWSPWFSKSVRTLSSLNNTILIPYSILFSLLNRINLMIQIFDLDCFHSKRDLCNHGLQLLVLYYCYIDFIIISYFTKSNLDVITCIRWRFFAVKFCHKLMMFVRWYSVTVNSRWTSIGR